MMWQLVLAEATGAAGEAGHDVPFYQDTHFWVGAGFVLFLALLFYLKVHKAAMSALDDRSAKIAAQLDEAASLRAQAEALLKDAAARSKAAADDAKSILANARTEADALVTKAETDGEAMVARRLHAAEEQIAAAERSAVEALRARVADLATAAAAKIFVSSADAATQSKLTDAAIKELDRRLN